MKSLLYNHNAHNIKVPHSTMIPEAVQIFFDMCSEPDIDGYEADTRYVHYLL